MPSAADRAAAPRLRPRIRSPASSSSGATPRLCRSALDRTMDVTRSVASPSDDIKKAAVFEKDALLSAQTMIYVRGRRPCYAVDAT